MPSFAVIRWFPSCNHNIVPKNNSKTFFKSTSTNGLVYLVKNITVLEWNTDNGFSLLLLLLFCLIIFTYSIDSPTPFFFSIHTLSLIPFDECYVIHVMLINPQFFFLFLFIVIDIIGRTIRIIKHGVFIFI